MESWIPHGVGQNHLGFRAAVSFRFITFLACKDILGAHIKDRDWIGRTFHIFTCHFGWTGGGG